MLKIIRILETLFLLVYFYAEKTAVDIINGHFAFGLYFNIDFGPTEQPAVLSTLFIGYLLSFLGTLSQKGRVNKKIWIVSLSLSSLGLISYINEFFRLFIGYNLIFMLDVPFLLIILDWILTGEDFKKKKY